MSAIWFDRNGEPAKRRAKQKNKNLKWRRERRFMNRRPWSEIGWSSLSCRGPAPVSGLIPGEVCLWAPPVSDCPALWVQQGLSQAVVVRFPPVPPAGHRGHVTHGFPAGSLAGGGSSSTCVWCVLWTGIGGQTRKKCDKVSKLFLIPKSDFTWLNRECAARNKHMKIGSVARGFCKTRWNC